MARLSDKNNSLTFVPAPQSPDRAGFVKETADDVVPDGWLECNGQAVSRTTYSELFNLIGTTYGVGDGSTTFNLPARSPLANETFTLDISSSGNFSAGQPSLEFSKTPEGFITLYFPLLAHSSSTNPQTATGVIPTEFRPTERVENVYFISSSAIAKVIIDTTGRFQTAYYNSSFTLTALTNTGFAGCISYYTTN